MTLVCGLIVFPLWMLRFFLRYCAYLMDYHWDHLHCLYSSSYHTQTMTHTYPSDDSLLVHLLVVSVAFQVPVLLVSAWRIVVLKL
jgi:hypothetical protein